MTRNIILAGVGGQGILTIAAIIDHAAMQKGLSIRQAEVHGMSQRGGAVQSHLRISDRELFSDLIPLGQADLILSLEPMESLRYLPYLSEKGTLITAIEPVKNIRHYPDVNEVLDSIRHSGFSFSFVDAERLSREAGSAKTANIVMAGAASSYLGIEREQLEESIRAMFRSKGDDMIAMNLKAFHLGLQNTTL